MQSCELSLCYRAKRHGLEADGFIPVMHPVTKGRKSPIESWPYPMIDELKALFLFNSLTEAQLERVARHAVRIRLAERESLFEQDDEADRFFVLCSGQVKLFRLSAGGHEKIIEVVGPGETFAEALMFLAQPRYPVCAEALRSSELISIDARDFSRMLRESVESCFAVMGAMSQRIRGLLHEIDVISLHSATCRVAAYLVEHLPEHGDGFTLPVAKQVVASRLSVTPETFSRAVRTLTQRGVIRLEGNEVQVLDRAQLHDLATV